MSEIKNPDISTVMNMIFFLSDFIPISFPPDWAFD
jgi:hypothetical protein